MAEVNNISRMKELINLIRDADLAYFGKDAPTITDREYDLLVEELKGLEAATGIVFANSPTKKVGGINKSELKKVTHTKPMLSAKKTKQKSEVYGFALGQQVMLSWKMDGLSLVLRYKDGCFTQAVTRGEDGLVGEDITHTVMYLRNIPKKVPYRDNFEVRGEGVISWPDFKILNRNADQGHPRNLAAGLVRAENADRGSLSHMDFFAFELIMPSDKSVTKAEQLDFLTLQGFRVVEHTVAEADIGQKAFTEVLDTYVPEEYNYPVDGIIIEYNDIAYGRSLGATQHHENRMLALKWEDGVYETVFRGVELSTTRNGQVGITAVFDPVMIDGSMVGRADLHSVNTFEKFRFGIGDIIKVYRANMIIPQIAENVTMSGTYKLPERCSCCGSKLQIKISAGGSKSLHCPNESCIAKNAQKIAHFCDKDAMNIEGLSASVLEKLMSFGFVKNFTDLYHLEEKREKILTTPGFGFDSYDKIHGAVERSRKCHLWQFLSGVGISHMGKESAKAIDEYFLGSFEDFENAIREGFSFFHIAEITESLSRNIFNWYADENEERLWRPLLKEISFIKKSEKVGEDGNPFRNANVVITGAVNGMNRQEITELLRLLGAHVSENVTKNTNYLIVGENPGNGKLAQALTNHIQLVMESQFARMLAGTEAS